MRAKRVLVAVNGTSADEEAIRLSCGLAKKARGKVFVTYVIQVDRTLPLDAEVKAEMEKGEQVLSQAERIADDQDFCVETDLLQAREIGPAIVEEAIARRVDLVTIGLSYKRKFGEFSLGTVIPYVLRNAPCWVLISREPISEEEHEQA